MVRISRIALATLLAGIAGAAVIGVSINSGWFTPSRGNSFEAIVNTADADRFVELFERTGGFPTAAQLEAEYLADAGAGLALLAQTRFQGADDLAAAIEADPEKYERAIRVCLPLAKSAQSDLRVIYRRLHELLPEYELPEVHAVFGAGTSAGTAAPGVQLLGLEVICAARNTEEEIRETFRFFFAHESVHAFQGMPSADVYASDPLLVMSIYEGVADYIAMIVTGRVPDPERDRWARDNSEMLWAQYAADRDILRRSAERGETLRSLSPEARDALRRWHFNAGVSPSGWPDEAGYWIGRQIVTGYIERAADEALAIRELLHLEDPIGALEISGLADRLRVEPNFEERSNG